MAIIKGANGNDYLVGTPTNDIIYGYNGDDTLDGGSGADALYGGYGSDTYYVDNVGDVLIEDSDSALGGVDRVFSTVNFTLGFGLENLTLTGTGNINGTGNGNNNAIFGNSANNILDGGLGADTLYGGDGSDIYCVDNAGDLVTEYYNNASGGVDTVLSTVNFTLGFGLENLTFTGTGNINGTGNGNNNVIIGNSANNILYVGLGADTLKGGDGSDTYYVDNVRDVVTEYYNDASGGVDTVFSTVNFTLGFGLENLTLTGAGNINGLVNGTGNDNNNVITGNSVDNILSGGLGNDTLIGGLGHDTLIGGLSNDTLIGGLGADTFVFNNRSEGVDIIKDFQWTEGDTIQLSKIGFGATSLSQFNYNNLNGNLSFLGTTFATIENKPSGFVVSLDVVLV